MRNAVPLCKILLFISASPKELFSTVLQANIVLSKRAASTRPSPLRASTTASKKGDHTPDISFTELVRGFNELIPSCLYSFIKY